MLKGISGGSAMPELIHPTSESLLHPSQIVMATDLCDAEILLPLAIAQAKATHAQVTLVHALLTSVMTPWTAEAMVPPDGGMDAEEFAERILAELVQKARAEGVTCDSLVRHGVSASEVVRGEVDRLGADRLIIGTHGRGRMGQLVLGSVAKNLLRSVVLPIFAVGPKVKTPRLVAEPKRILFAVALKDQQQDLLDADVARKLAEGYGAELILMHVVGPEAEQDGQLGLDIEESKVSLDALIPDKTTMTVELRTHVACGEIVEEILESASRFEADWILMGWNEQHRHGALAETAVYRVMASAFIPVLTLPHPRKSLRTAAIRQRETSTATR
jgi:nucleotide-binding universal stress UspA family protein